MRTFYHPDTKKTHEVDFFVPKYRDQLAEFLSLKGFSTKRMKMKQLRLLYIKTRIEEEAS